MTGPSEAAFEAAIAASLVETGGYLGPVKVGRSSAGPSDLDPAAGIDTAELFAFIGATQPEEWERSVTSHSAPDEAQRAFVAPAREGARRAGHGRRAAPRRQGPGRQRRVRLAYFKPAHGLNARAERALPGEPADRHPPAAVRRRARRRRSTSCLFVNGIPVATAELKNPLTGQTVEHAMKQYRQDRDPTNATLRSARASSTSPSTPTLVVHDHPLAGARHAVPAVQPGRRRTARATRRSPPATAPPTCGRRSGSATPGSTSCAASSTSSHGRRRRRPGTVIFPRYHQWDAVLAARGRTPAPHGAGHVLPRPALGRVGQVEHHRLARPPALDAARRRRRQGLRQGRRHHRPASCSTASCRTRSTSSSTRTGVVEKIDAGLRRSSPTRSPGEQAPHHHHHAAEVPVRARQGRRAARPAPLRRHRRRGPLLADRRGRQGPEDGARGGRRARPQLEAAEAEDGEARREDRPGRGRARRVGRRPRPAAEPVVLRLHRDAEGPDAGAVRHGATRRRQRTSRSTSTRCARRSRRASSSTCSPTTRPTTTYWQDRRRRSPTTPRSTSARRAGAIARFVVAAPAQPRRRRPRSSSSTSAQHTAPQDRRPGQGDGRHRRRASTPSATSRRIDRYLADKRLRRRRRRWSRSPARSSTTTGRSRSPSRA